MTISGAIAGSSLRVFGSEELLSNRTVKRHGTSSNINDVTWLLGQGWSRIVTHEYFEARYWQLESSAFEQGLEVAVAAWFVMYAGVADEGERHDVWTERVVESCFRE